MFSSIELLKKRYFKNINTHPTLFIGIELESPVVNLDRQATDFTVVQNLMSYLASALNFTIEKVDDFGHPIQLVDCKSQDSIVFEVS